MVPQVSNSSSLNGLNVIEFSHFIMGPVCGLVLGDLGANVTKIEPAPKGDKTRYLEGSAVGFFPMYNRNKQSVFVDLSCPGDRVIVQEMISRADVLIENFRPGVMAEVGLDYESVSKWNPSLVYCSMSGYLTGPYDGLPAMDEVVQVATGLAYMTGPPGQPMRAGASVTDVLAGVFAAVGILSKLHERESTNRGGFVRSGLFETGAFLMGQHLCAAQITGRVPEPMSVRNLAWGIYDYVRSRDDIMLFIGVVTDAQWVRFCRLFGLNDLAQDRKLATNSGRVAARPRLLSTVRAKFASMLSEDIVSRCTQEGIMCVRVREPQELIDDAHMLWPGRLLDVTLKGGRKVRVPALPLEIDGRTPDLRCDLPEWAPPEVRGADLASGPGIGEGGR